MNQLLNVSHRVFLTLIYVQNTKYYFTIIGCYEVLNVIYVANKLTIISLYRLNRIYYTHWDHWF